jgi:hypothetical protein
MRSIYPDFIEIKLAPREEGTCCKCGKTFEYIRKLGYCPFTGRDDCGDEQDEEFSGSAKKKSVDLHQCSRLVLV